ncbi:hypothetical protein SU69_06285 [Thermosipho melanesiensis]|uniref:PrcB C-terminal domain-containing protein n=2 Tax=Thermosipho melanesiensis TaxID=46541 RepID=A6LME0_THEM4|nr:protease complex subunit PrcB family protein [Thermosipho melanesiensis]ABR31091.1 hypothetical protein Tmel_1238 [Thermosipho melanesiensis BI429]APT74186.1 hypothetical protein BW47_06585 [Thermosipho melanesiensis]OOC36130.1 hypothetical protein SU68_06355 [Thermosipho melanesiensis]OOC36947.1 hypothetical protein SU69_06285 [Thermosipho melanesiensis]OOC37699.1 hypothetical protein SU70_06295 [Thermosipho melanesiensis]
MKKKIIFLFLFLVSVAFSSGVMIFKVDKVLPDDLFEVIGTKSNTIYYFKLFDDGVQKGYVIKGWYFTPNNFIGKTNVKIISSLSSFLVEIGNERKGNYSVIPTFMLICPSDSKVVLDKYEIDQKMLKAEIGDIVMPRFNEMGIYTGIFEKKFIQKDIFSQDDEIYVVISMGLRKTGGYSLELESYEIKENEIIINLNLKSPGKGDMVTQAFTIPSYNLKLGKLKRGKYTIKVFVRKGENIERFLKNIEVK